jgi:cytoskeleton protein RodZ
LIPLVLIAAIGAAALYEYLRPGDLQRGFETRTLPVRPAPPDPVAPPSGTPSGTPLPNPIVSGAAGEAPRTDGALPPPAPAVDTAPVGAPPLAPPGPAGSGAIVTSPASASAAVAPAAATGEATLVIAYRATSWTEVRDRDGKVVLQVTGMPGTSQTVTGKPPFDLTLGNAGENSVTWRGAPFDLTPHLRQNVARVRLP